MFTIKPNKSTKNSINWQEMECVRMELPVFNPDHPDKVHFSDIVQGEIGSCWFLSVLISYIRPNEKNITERAMDIHRFIKEYRQEDNRTIYKISLGGKKVLVDDYIPISYHNNILKEPNLKCIWFILFEKAMLSLMTYKETPSGSKTFEKMLYVPNINIKHGEMKASTIGIGYLISGKNRYYCLHKKDRNSSIPHITASDLYSRFKNGNHITANTAKSTYPGNKYTFHGPVSSVGGVCSHCYAIIDLKYCKRRNTYMVTIQNPWGKKELSETKGVTVYPENTEKGRGLSVITWERFHHLFACVHVTE